MRASSSLSKNQKASISRQKNIDELEYQSSPPSLEKFKKKQVVNKSDTKIKQQQQPLSNSSSSSINNEPIISILTCSNKYLPFVEKKYEQSNQNKIPSLNVNETNYNTNNLNNNNNNNNRNNNIIIINNNNNKNTVSSFFSINSLSVHKQNLTINEDTHNELNQQNPATLTATLMMPMSNDALSRKSSCNSVRCLIKQSYKLIS
jgi:hypothetical protein